MDRQDRSEAAGISERTASKWLARYEAEGEAGLIYRTSRPATIPIRVPEERWRP
jgi:transposase